MIEVRTSDIHGRGVFAVEEIAEAQHFHTAHLLVFESEEYEALQQTLASHYVFYIRDSDTIAGAQTTGLAMSPISFINHASPANAAFLVDAENLVIHFTALRNIRKHEELTINYGDFAVKLGID